MARGFGPDATDESDTEKDTVDCVDHAVTSHSPIPPVPPPPACSLSPIARAMTCTNSVSHRPAKPALSPAVFPLDEDGSDSFDNYKVPGPDEDIWEDAVEGTHLYMEFIRTEIRREGLTEPSGLSNLESMVAGVPENKYLDWSKAGRELRQLADAFAKSEERQTVRRRAQAVQLTSLSFEHFCPLLKELFHFNDFRSLSQGITRERILVLFFFCADVAIEALRRGFHTTFHQLIKWSLKYIATKVAQWVHWGGGWETILESSLAVACQLSACVAFMAFTVACMVYIRRNIL